MISYVRQVAIGNSVLETIKQTLAQSNDKAIRAKIVNIPTTESVLRAVSVFPNLDTEEELKNFIKEHIINDLCLTEIQKEHFGLHGENRKALEDVYQPAPKLT